MNMRSLQRRIEDEYLFAKCLQIINDKIKVPKILMHLVFSRSIDICST